MLYGVSKYVLIKKCCFSQKFHIVKSYIFTSPLTFYHSTACGTFYHSTNHVVHSENDYDERYGEEIVILKFFN